MSITSESVDAGTGASTCTASKRPLILESVFFFALFSSQITSVHGFSLNNCHHPNRCNGAGRQIRKVSFGDISTPSSLLPKTRRPLTSFLTPPPSQSLSSSSPSSSSSLYYKSNEDDHDGDKVTVNTTIKDLGAPPPPSPTPAVQAVSTPKSSSKRVLRSSPIQNLITIENIDDFTDCIQANRKKVVVARFFASWCKTCKQTEPSFVRFARRNPNIVFMNIPFNKRDNKLFEELHVNAVPYSHVYQSGELVEEMRLTSKHFSKFEATVKDYYLSTKASMLPLSSSSSS